MSAVKLTLRLDESAIERGKQYAKANGTSLSKLVEQYLERIAPPPPIDESKLYIAPHLKALMLNVPEDFIQGDDYRTEYYEYYGSKHLREEE